MRAGADHSEVLTACSAAPCQACRSADIAAAILSVFLAVWMLAGVVALLFCGVWVIASIVSFIFSSVGIAIL